LQRTLPDKPSLDCNHFIHEIKGELKTNLKNFKRNLESLNSEISVSINEFKKETNYDITFIKNEIGSSFKKLNDFHLFGLQSDIPFGIQNNFDVSKFTVSGFSYVYNIPYSHKTKSSEMDKIQKSCLPTTT
jgi:hypothetical protein